MKNEAGLTCAGADVDIDAGNAHDVLRVLRPAGEDPVAPARVVAVDSGERVIYSRRLWL